MNDKNDLSAESLRAMLLRSKPLDTNVAKYLLKKERSITERFSESSFFRKLMKGTRSLR